MKFNRLYEEDLKTIYPNCTNISLDNMPENQKKKYLLLYNMYRKLFTVYIMQKLKLKSYDKKIEKSELGFTANKKQDMDIYQYFSSDILKYFYIRNNIYIEKLNKKEIDFLEKKIQSKNYELDDETMQIIESSYRRVIFEDVLKNGELCKTLYGPNSSNFFADNNAIIIGVRYDEFAENKLNDDEWDELHQQQVEFLESLITRMNKNLNSNSAVPIEILEYSEFSIIPRKKFKSDHEDR